MVGALFVHAVHPVHYVHNSIARNCAHGVEITLTYDFCWSYHKSQIISIRSIGGAAVLRNVLRDHWVKKLSTNQPDRLVDFVRKPDLLLDVSTELMLLALVKVPKGRLKVARTQVPGKK